MNKKLQEDNFLSKLVNSNDSELWDEFYKRYDDFILMIIRTMVKQSDEVNDLAQEVRLQIWRKIHLYKPGLSKFTTWLSRVVKNKVIDHLKKKYSYNERNHEFGETIKTLTQDYSSDVEKNAKEEWQKHLFTLAKDKVRNEFSPQVYSVFTEISEGSNTSDIAKKLKIASNTVHVYKRRIKKALQSEISRLKLEST